MSNQEVAIAIIVGAISVGSKVRLSPTVRIRGSGERGKITV